MRLLLAASGQWGQLIDHANRFGARSKASRRKEAKIAIVMSGLRTFGCRAPSPSYKSGWKKNAVHRLGGSAVDAAKHRRSAPPTYCSVTAS